MNERENENVLKHRKNVIIICGLLHPYRGYLVVHVIRKFLLSTQGERAQDNGRRYFVFRLSLFFIQEEVWLSRLLVD